ERSIEVSPSNGTVGPGGNGANQRIPTVFLETHNELNATIRVGTDGKLVDFSKPSSRSSNGRVRTLQDAKQHRSVSERNETGNGFGPSDEGDSPRRIDGKPSSSDRNDYPLLFAWWEIRLFVELTVAILLCVSIVIGRLVVQRRRTAKDGDDKFQTSNTGETTLPNGFTDDISEIDADIDLQTPLPVPSVSRSDVSTKRESKLHTPTVHESAGAPSRLPQSNQTCLPFTCSLHAFALPATCGYLFNDCRPTTNAPTATRNDGISTRQSYGPYTPSPGPYGNLGPSNISHTSTTMLVPPCSMGTIMSTSQPPGYLGGPINIMPSQLGSSIGTIRTPLAAMTTLPRPHQASQQLPPGFLGGSVIGTQTLRRLSSDHDGNTPRSLSRGATNAQYYYG
uniref:Uncharacterized protein n=1 Tax=Anopheles christyi TaxID=43041 RepID=A0A182KDM5_9DIPT